MTTDPIKRLPSAFGKLLGRLRIERKLAPETLAALAGLSDAATVTEMEHGEREPTLTELFRIANALRIPPAFLYIDVIAAWHADPADYWLYKSRVTDFVQLYRLGYYHDAGDFRELPRVYGLLDEATGASRTLNLSRQKKGLLLLDTVSIYVRLGSLPIQPDAAKPEG